MGRKGRCGTEMDGDRLSRSHDLVLPEFRLATGLYSPRSPDITASSSFKLMPLGIQQTSQKQALYSSIEETRRRAPLDKQISVSRDQGISWKSRTRAELPTSWQNPLSLLQRAPGPRYWASPFMILQQPAPDKPLASHAEYTDSTHLISIARCFNSHPSCNWGPEDGP